MCYLSGKVFGVSFNWRNLLLSAVTLPTVEFVCRRFRQPFKRSRVSHKNISSWVLKVFLDQKTELQICSKILLQNILICSKCWHAVSIDKLLKLFIALAPTSTVSYPLFNILRKRKMDDEFFARRGASSAVELMTWTRTWDCVNKNL